MATNRSPWLDNAKGSLILLVVWGHLIEQVATVSPVVSGVYGAIYLFHMPAFVLISGMVSRAELTRQTLGDIGWRLLLPLAVFQALYWPVLAHVTPGRVQDPMAPFWILWFLLSLATWRLMLPVFVRLRFAVPVSIAIALGAGFFDHIDHTLSLSRTLVFFPAFLIGHLYRSQIDAVAGRVARAGPICLALLAGTAGLYAANGGDFTPFYGSLPYAGTGGAAWLDALERLVILLGGVTAAVAFLSLVPRHAGPLTELGARSLPIFLLHGFGVLIFWLVTSASGFPNDASFLIVTAMLTIVIAFSIARFSQLLSLPGWRSRSLP